MEDDFDDDQCEGCGQMVLASVVEANGGLCPLCGWSGLCPDIDLCPACGDEISAGQTTMCEAC